ncbi:MAG: 1-acyl-sn-glycerol-3-phosphate acyltransferase [Chitinophagales bacterium]|nr:1-acyl-sn-glycerol-3-phosphate acyltransferase [Chitinophagales bacterium]
MFDNAIDEIKQWPISKIAEKRDKVLEEIESESILDFEKAYPNDEDLRAQLQKTLYLEQIRIKTESWEVDPEDEKEFWNGVKRKLLKASNTEEIEKYRQTNQLVLSEIIERYANEIIGDFSPKLYWFARQLLRRFFSRLFNSHFGGFKGLLRPQDLLVNKLIVTGHKDEMLALSKKGTIVLVPTHFSNLDSVLIGFGMDYIGMPAFQYGAGLNLFNSKFFSLFMGNLGAYKLDRRKKNPIYLETLKKFSKINIEHGAHTIFFPGGTRSRSGAIENSLKLGLLGTVLEAQRHHFEQFPANLAPKIYVVPLTISYNFVLEAASLIDQYLKITGKDQYLIQSTSAVPWKSVWKFFWETFSQSSDVSLSIGKPMDVLGNYLNEDGESIDNNGKVIELQKYFFANGKITEDAQRESVYTAMLGEKIVKSFKINNIVYASHVVPFVAFELLKQKINTNDLFTILRIPEEEREIDWDIYRINMKIILDALYDLNNKQKLKLSPKLTTLELEEIIAHGMKNISIYHTNLPLLRTKEGNITSEDLKLLYYYHNRLLGYDLEKLIRY